MRNKVVYYKALTELTLISGLSESERKDKYCKEYGIRGYIPTGFYEFNVNSDFGWLHKDYNELCYKFYFVVFIQYIN